MSTIDGDNESIYFSTHQKYQDKIIQQIGCDKNKLILEPERKNTAPAIALVVKYLEDVIGCGENEVVLIAPADHVISPVKAFSDYILSWIASAQQGNIVVFGITPTAPETWYGYIKYTSHTWWSVFAVQEFAEKPNVSTAREYIASGQYLWNAGIFMFTIKTIKDAFATYCPSLFQLMQESYDVFIGKFSTLESISFDYAIMEKAKNVMVCPMDLLRSDIWSRDAVEELLIQQKVINTNPYLMNDDKNNLIFSQKKVIVDGIENSFVIVSEAGVYVAKKWNSQAIKGLL